jgi:hypothetical protein
MVLVREHTDGLDVAHALIHRHEPTRD